MVDPPRPRAGGESLLAARRACLPALRRGTLFLALATGGCADAGTTGPPSGAAIEVRLEGLGPLNPASDGVYELWVVDTAGRVLSAGRFDVDDASAFTVVSPAPEPKYLMLTIEPPGDEDDAPSLMRLIGGRFGSDGSAALEATGYLTPIGMPLETDPGVHVLGTACAPVCAVPAPPDAGLWLIDARVDSTEASFFQTLTPLTRGWSYEGWVVRDHGTPQEVWVSYGQFVPNNLRKARLRDDTGIGPFSGFADYEQALIATIHYPGDDWLANPHGYAVPGGLTLPLDLNGDAGAGEPSRWTHVITIEPVLEADGIRTEPPWEAVPFFLRPYRNAIGEAPPEVPRSIGFQPEALPRGSARLKEG